MNGISLGHTAKVTAIPLHFGHEQENARLNQPFNGIAFQPPAVQHAIANLSAQEIGNINQPSLQLARSTGIRPGLFEPAQTRRGAQAESYAQPIINSRVNNLIREIQQVRPNFTYNRITSVGQPYNQSDIDALNQTIAPIRAELLAQLPDLNPTLASRMSLGDLDNQVHYKTYLANGGKASFIEWSTEKPSDPKYSTLPGDQNVQVIYKSIKDAPNYPQGFRDIQNGTVKTSIKRSSALEMLRKYERGDWSKVYKDGFDSSGNKVSLHYFLSQSGKVFDFHVVQGKWSNDK